MHDQTNRTRNERIISAIAQVRGRAQTSGGAVIVETDVHGTITDLQIAPAAMAVDGGRLAKAIAQCHQTARQRADAEANRIYAEMMDIVPPSTPTNSSQEWEEPRSTRITRVV